MGGNVRFWARVGQNGLNGLCIPARWSGDHDDGRGKHAQGDALEQRETPPTAVDAAIMSQMSAEVRSAVPSPTTPSPTTPPATTGGPDDEGPVDRLQVLVAGLALGLLMALVLVGAALRLVNRDTWFHLTLGQHFRTDWSLTHPGALTPFATSAWVPTQWSTEVVASAAEKVGGLPAVAFLFGALYLVLILVVYIGCREVAAPTAATVATFAGILGAAPAISSRPQVVSLVLLTLTVTAWRRTATDGRPRWWLVPVTWAWATAHGMWSLGVLLGVVCCVGLVLDRRVGPRRGLLLLGVPVASLAAAALTPVGPRLLASQLAVSDRSTYIAEWARTRFDGPPELVVALTAAVVLLVWLLRRGRLSWTSALLFLVAVGWTVSVSRLVACGAIVLAPLLAEALNGRRPSGWPPARLERAAVGLGALGYLVALGLLVPHTAAVAGDVPRGLVPRLQALPPGSTVLNADDLGAWIEWRTPAVHPVIDGMLDAYPVDYIRRYKQFARAGHGWQDFVQRSGSRVAILRDSSRVTTALQAQLHWRVVDRDGKYVYLVAPRA